MSKRTILRFCLLITVLLITGLVEAQQPAKVPRVGFLTGAPLSSQSARNEAFRQGLRELGYVEGKNIVIEWRSYEGKMDRLPVLAAELVRLKVDVIVTGGSSDIRAAKEATSTIPIVMLAGAGDAVASGFVASLPRPSGNITGVSTLRPELSGKRLEILKETIPKLSRVAFIVSSGNDDFSQELKEIEMAARAFGLTVQHLDIKSGTDIDIAFQAANKGRAGAVLFRVAGPYAAARRPQIAEFAVKNGLPVIYESAEYVESSGLMSYGVSTTDVARRAATYVDKILKGAKPAELPVEQPTKFELLINLKAAKRIGLTIPPTVLARADRIIR